MYVKNGNTSPVGVYVPSFCKVRVKSNFSPSPVGCPRFLWTGCPLSPLPPVLRFFLCYHSTPPHSPQTAPQKKVLTAPFYSTILFAGTFSPQGDSPINTAVCGRNTDSPHRGQEGETMLFFTAVNTATGDRQGLLAYNIGDAYTKALRYIFTGKGDAVRVYPNCPTYLAVQIAKTVSRKTLSYMETPTQRRIMDCLDRGTAKFNHSLQGTTSDYICTALFNSYGLQETDSRGTVIKPCLFNADTQDFISIALYGILSCPSDDIVEKAGAGFRELNRYIETLRTRREKEILTAYDIETDSPVNTEIRRIVKGLTEKETENGQGAKDGELSKALQDVSETLTATQRDIFYRLAKGCSLYRVSKDLHRDKKTIKEHRGYIQKKALRNDTIRLYLLDNKSPLTYTDIENTAPNNETWKAQNDILCRTAQGGQWAGKSAFAYIAPTAHKTDSTAPTAPTATGTAPSNIITVWTKDGQPRQIVSLAKMKSLPVQDGKKALRAWIKGYMDSHRGTAQYKRIVGHNPRYIDRVVNLNQTALYR